MDYIKVSVEEVHLIKFVEAHRGEPFCKTFMVNTNCKIGVGITLSIEGKYFFSIFKSNQEVGSRGITKIMWINVAHPFHDGDFIPTNFEGYVIDKINEEKPDFIIVSSTKTPIEKGKIKVVPLRTDTIPNFMERNQWDIHIRNDNIGRENGSLLVATPGRNDNGSSTSSTSATSHVSIFPEQGSRNPSNGLYFLFSPSI